MKFGARGMVSLINVYAINNCPYVLITEIACIIKDARGEPSCSADVHRRHYGPRAAMRAIIPWQRGPSCAGVELLD
jgi:hypothetical protein